MVDVQVVGNVVAQLGECPLWSPEEGVLYWEDIDGKQIHRYDPETDQTTSRSLPGRPGSFAPTQTPGRFVVATESGLVWLDWESGDVHDFVTVEDPDRANRLNDGRCDHSGRFIVGTMWPETRDRRFDGSLYSIDPTGAVETLETDVGVPNGLVFDPARERMYWADTFHATIWKWDYDVDTGARSNKQVFFNYADHEDAPGLPDGGCLDSEGYYWSASVTGWALTRISPAGDVDRRIELPVAKPTMLAFGGPDLTTIYVTSIDGGEVDEARMQGVKAGSLLRVDGVGIAGVPEPSFGA